MSELQQLDAEVWLARRLGDFGAIFAGVTDREIRKRRIREAILEANLEHAIAGRGRDGRPETFAQTFQRLYGSPLRVPGSGPGGSTTHSHHLKEPTC